MRASCGLVRRVTPKTVLPTSTRGFLLVRIVVCTNTYIDPPRAYSRLAEITHRRGSTSFPYLQTIGSQGQPHHVDKHNGSVDPLSLTFTLFVCCFRGEPEKSLSYRRASAQNNIVYLFLATGRFLPSRFSVDNPREKHSGTVFANVVCGYYPHHFAKTRTHDVNNKHFHH